MVNIYEKHPNLIYLKDIFSKCLIMAKENHRQTIMERDISVIVTWFPKPNSMIYSKTILRKIAKSQGCNRVSGDALYCLKHYLCC